MPFDAFDKNKDVNDGFCSRRRGTFISGGERSGDRARRGGTADEGLEHGNDGDALGRWTVVLLVAGLCETRTVRRNIRRTQNEDKQKMCGVASPGDGNLGRTRHH